MNKATEAPSGTAVQSDEAGFEVVDSVIESVGPFESTLAIAERCGWGDVGGMYYLSNTRTDARVSVTIKILTKAGNQQGIEYRTYRVRPGERKQLFCSLSGNSPTELSHHELTIVGEIFG